MWTAEVALMQPKNHWEKVYSTKSSNYVSWFQEHARLSLELIRKANLPLTASLIDVGGGASRLVDDLLKTGYEDITVLDLSAAALASTKNRLGGKGNKLHWLEANITDVTLSNHAYDLWHDRAVFHFLIKLQDRKAYSEAARHTIKPGGHMIVATFGEGGPAQCSGLPVMRYGVDSLNAEFKESFTLIESLKEEHRTPMGTTQNFIYCLFKKSTTSSMGSSCPQSEQMSSNAPKK